MFKPKRIISWGGGVQSTTLAAMVALGDLPPVDAVIFADPQWERAATYEVMDWYRAWLTRRGVNVIAVSAGNIRELGAREHIHIPFWTATGGPLRRQCSRHFKVRAVRRAVRDLFNLPNTPEPGSVETLIGFSLDEWGRMKSSGVQFMVNRWPLIYDKRMDRGDCIAYLQDHGLPVPVKSACIGCPYRAASEWLSMPESERADGIAFDEENRHNPLAAVGSTADALYIYGHGPVALRQADLEADAARERDVAGFQIPMLCEEGFCHV